MTISSHKRKLQKTRRFARDIKKIPSNVKKKAFKVARKLAEDVFASDLDIRKLMSVKDVYRVRGRHERLAHDFLI